MKNLITLILLAWSLGAGATDTYCSFSRGNDTTGDGSESTPYKTLSKCFAGTAPAYTGGDNVYLACDDTWSISGKTFWKAGNTGTSDSSRITVTGYEPDGVTCGTSKPTISFYDDTSTGEWTWDGDKSAWYYAYSDGTYGGVIVLLGASYSPAKRIEHFTNSTAFESTGQWDYSSTVDRVYLWTPDENTNPVTYYSGVRVLLGPAFYADGISGAEEMGYTTFDGIKFDNVGTAISVYVKPTTGVAYAGLTVKNSIFSTVGSAISIFSDNTDSTKATAIRIHDNTFTNSHSFPVIIKGQTNDIDVYSNTFDGCNIQLSNGGCVYAHGDDGTTITDQDFRIYKNTIRNAVMGAQSDHDGDGHAIYFEVDCTGCSAFQNLIEKSDAAFHVNGGDVDIYSNVARDVGVFLTAGDGAPTNRTNIKLYHNSATCRLTSALSQYSGSGPSTYRMRACAYFGDTTLNNAAEVVDARNNIFSVVDDGTTLGGKGLTVDGSDTGTLTETDNIIYGARISYGYSGDDEVRNLDASSSTASPQWTGGNTPAALSGFSTQASSPARKTGVTLSGFKTDYRGRPFKPLRSIGAIEATSGDPAEARTAR